MRISDWSSDVCSSDLYLSSRDLLPGAAGVRHDDDGAFVRRRRDDKRTLEGSAGRQGIESRRNGLDRPAGARKSVVYGKSVSVRVDIGGRRFLKNNQMTLTTRAVYISMYTTT